MSAPRLRAVLARLVLAALLVATLPAAGCSGAEEPRMTTPEQARRTATLQAAGRTLTVELALDDAARSRGLKHRTQLAPDAGMLFVFTSPRPQRFWMQDTLIPLDILFLDPDGTVQNVARGEPGVEQPGYTSRGAALYVLELAAGWCEQHGLKPGDKVAIPPELARLAR